MFRILISAITLCAVTTVAVSAGEPPETALATLPHVSFPAPHRVASGALQASDIAMLKQAGVGEVIDLRTAGETPDFDEAAAVRKAGIPYHSLPIHGADGLTRANVMRFDKLLSAAGDTTTLVHCASSNRVGAMIALRAALIDGQSTKAALAEGRRWGLKSLEPAVRERLGAWSTSSSPMPATSH